MVAHSDPIRVRADLGPRVGVLAGTLRMPCTVCDAPAGERCRVWRLADGARLYVKGPRVKPHQARTAAYHASQGVDHDGTRQPGTGA